jgi:hypothetical protein
MIILFNSVLLRQTPLFLTRDTMHPFLRQQQPQPQVQPQQQQQQQQPTNQPTNQEHKGAK